MSTNLPRGHLETPVSSAYDDGDIYLWLPGRVCLLASGELGRAGNVRERSLQPCA
jgi:hypothetical protein